MPGQLIRYGVTGLLANAVLYAVYLLMTAFGVGPKTAATIAYGLGVSLAFHVNRSWTFQHAGRGLTALHRFLAAYAIGYLLNLALLYLLVDLAGLTHEWVQGAAIVMVAAVLFPLQKHWVFQPSPRVE